MRAGDFTDPLAWVHSKIEGTYEYTLLLFIPSRAPLDLWMPQGRGIKLHIGGSSCWRIPAS